MHNRMSPRSAALVAPRGNRLAPIRLVAAALARGGRGALTSAGRRELSMRVSIAVLLAWLCFAGSALAETRPALVIGDDSFQLIDSWPKARADADGDASSMTKLGWVYDNGFGVPQDYAKAREWYEKGAAAGDAVAMRYLGFLYQNAHGVPQDYAKAREW